MPHNQSVEEVIVEATDEILINVNLWDNARVGIEKNLRKVAAASRREALEEVKQNMLKIKNYYNPVGDKFNQGKHALADEVIHNLDLTKPNDRYIMEV